MRVLLGVALVLVWATAAAAQGPVAAYAFDEGTGATTADATGQAHTGTLAGATWAPAGKYGAALAFNGVNSLVTVADAADLDLTTGMTLEAWIWPATVSNWQSAILKEQPGGLVYALYANEAVPHPSVTLSVGGLDRNTPGAAPLALTVWTHLAATYDGLAAKLYVNGVLVATTPVTGAIAASTGALRIGGNAVWGEYVNGVMDEVRIYNRALSAAEILTDMATPVGIALPPPPPPSATAASRLVWEQDATTLAAASALTYKHFPDAAATGTILPAVTCSGPASPFTCTVAFPAFTTGTHTEAISASNAAGESVKSLTLAFTYASGNLKPGAPTNLRFP